MKIKQYRYKTHGLYGWGVGWLNQMAARRWDVFWDALVGQTRYTTVDGKVKTLCPFHIIPRDDISCHQMYQTGGIIYLHPMDGRAFFESHGAVIINGRKVDVDFEKFKEIISDAVAYCGNGATVEFGMDEFTLRKEARNE